MLGTTSSLIIWVESYLASLARKGGTGEGAPPGEEEGAAWLKGGSFRVADVAP
jgi:hypothetical protein